jgi:hypothetical protein
MSWLMSIDRETLTIVGLTVFVVVLVGAALIINHRFPLPEEDDEDWMNRQI